MQRYFIDSINEKEKYALLKDNDFHHIKNVMRSQLSDFIIVCNKEGVCYKSKITEFENSTVKVVLSEKIDSMELPLEVDLAQSLIRKERFEYVLQKSTELGVNEIIPVTTKHSIISVDKKKIVKKLERWNKITKEASEQSHRNNCVQVRNVHSSLNEINFDSYDVVLVAYEKENQSKELKNMFETKYNRILIIIGPEGGFHKSEINMLSDKDNVHFVGLGKRILRSETASSYLLSIIGYHYEIGDLS